MWKIDSLNLFSFLFCNNPPKILAQSLQREWQASIASLCSLYRPNSKGIASQERGFRLLESPFGPQINIGIK